MTDRRQIEQEEQTQTTPPEQNWDAQFVRQILSGTTRDRLDSEGGDRSQDSRAAEAGVTFLNSRGEPVDLSRADAAQVVLGIRDRNGEKVLDIYANPQDARDGKPLARQSFSYRKDDGTITETRRIYELGEGQEGRPLATVETSLNARTRELSIKIATGGNEQTIVLDEHGKAVKFEFKGAHNLSYEFDNGKIVGVKVDGRPLEGAQRDDAIRRGEQALAQIRREHGVPGPQAAEPAQPVDRAPASEGQPGSPARPAGRPADTQGRLTDLSTPVDRAPASEGQPGSPARPAGRPADTQARPADLSTSVDRASQPAAQPDIAYSPGARQRMKEIQDLLTRLAAQMPPEVRVPESARATGAELRQPQDRAPADGEKRKIGASEVEFKQAADGTVRPAKITYPDGSSVQFTYDEKGFVKELVMTRKGPDGREVVAERLTSTDGKSYTRETDPRRPKIEGKVTIDESGKWTFEGKDARQSFKTEYNTDGSRSTSTDDGKGLRTNITIKPDGSIESRVQFPNNTATERSYDAQRKLKEQRSYDREGQLTERRSFDERGQLAGVKEYKAGDRENPSVSYERLPDGKWKKTDHSRQPPQEQVGSLTLGADGRISFRQEAAAQLPERTVEQRDRARIELAPVGDGGERKPVSIKWNDNLSADFKYKDGKLSEVTIKAGGEQATWVSDDGRNFKLKNDPSVTATIELADGKMTLTRKEGGKDVRTEFNTDGTQVASKKDDAGRDVKTVFKPDGSSEESIAYPDRIVTHSYDRYGTLDKVTEADPRNPDRPRVVYEPKVVSENGQTTVRWQKTDLSQQPPATEVGALELKRDGSPELTADGQVKFTPEKRKEAEKPPEQEGQRPQDRAPEVARSGDRPVEVRELSGEELARTRALQNVLENGLRHTVAEDLRKAQQEVFKEYEERLRNPSLTMEQRQALEKQFQEKLKQEQERLMQEVDRLAEDVKSERERGVFGPATQAAYRRYVEWMEKTAVPGAETLLAQYARTRPADSPRLLPVRPEPMGEGRFVDRPQDPRTFEADLRAGRLEPFRLGIDTTRPPSFDDLRRLGRTLNWMDEVNTTLNRERLQHEIQHTFPRIIQENNLPEGWRYREGQDPEAYRQAFLRADDAVSRTRSYITAAIDYLGATPEQLNLPPGVRVEVDPHTKRVTRIDMDLPQDLSLQDPTNREKIERLENWLNTKGRELQRTIDDFVEKQNDPSKFLFWGDIEMPPGSKWRAPDGREYDYNLLESRFDVRTLPSGEIEVSYTVRPQNSRWYNYLNIGAQNVTGADGRPLEYTETRRYRPGEMVVVRNGNFGVELKRAEDLAAWASRQKFSHYGEKAAVVTMDVGMTATGLIELRGAWAAARAGTTAARWGAREWAMQAVRTARYAGPGVRHVALGGTGFFLNNAEMHQNEMGRLANHIRGGIMLLDVAMGVPHQVRALAGAPERVGMLGRLLGTERIREQIGNFGWVTRNLYRHGLPISMELAQIGFAPSLYHDITADLTADPRRSYQRFEDAVRRVGRDTRQPAGEQSARQVESYAAQLNPADRDTRQRVDDIAAQTARLLRAKDEREYNAAEHQRQVDEYKRQLMEYIRPADGNVNKDLRAMAAAALLALSRGEGNRLPADGVLASREADTPQGRQRQEIRVQDLVQALRQDAGDRDAGSRRLVASELLVNLGDMRPQDYGRLLRQIEQDTRASDRDRQWARDRREFTERALTEAMRTEPVRDELELARRTLDSYQEKLKTADEPTRRQVQEITTEAKRLLELKKTMSAEEFERHPDVIAFRQRLMANFRRDAEAEGTEIADRERLRSERNNRHTTVGDAELRSEDVASGGPRGVNKDIQAVSAAALLLLSRDADNRLSPDAVIASRDVPVPGYTWKETVYDGEGGAHEIPHQVAARTETQTLRAQDLIAILQQDVARPELGSQRLIAADVLTNAGVLSPQQYAAVLRDTLEPKPGQPLPSAQDQRWALERLGPIVNALRVVEAHQELTMKPEDLRAERGRNFGLSSQDLTRVLEQYTGKRDLDPDLRAMAAATLNALRDSDPQRAQQQLIQEIGRFRESAQRPGSFSTDYIGRARDDLNSDHAETRMRAAITLAELGQISDRDYNKAMVSCIDARNPDLAIEAIRRLKVTDGARDLTDAERQQILGILQQPTTGENTALKMVILQNITKFAVGNDAAIVSRQLENMLTGGTDAFDRHMKASPRLREAAVTALGDLNQPGAATVLQHRLNPAVEDSAAVRLAALNSLARMNVPNLHEIARQHMAVERDPAVQARARDLEFQVRRPPSGEAYRQAWEETQRRMRVTAPPNAPLTREQTEQWLERNGYNLLHNGNQHSGTGFLGEGQRRYNKVAADRSGFFLNFGRTLGLAEKGDRAAFNAVNQDMIRDTHAQMSRLREAAKSNPQALAALLQIVESNAEIAHPDMRDHIRQHALDGILDVCRQGSGTAREYARWAIEHGLKQPNASPDVRRVLLEGLRLLINDGMPEGDRRRAGAISSEEAAHILEDALKTEWLRRPTGADARPGNPRYDESVRFQNALLDEIKKIGHRGFYPQLDAISTSFDYPEVKQKAREVLADLRDRVSPMWERTQPSQGNLEQKARDLEAALRNGSQNPDIVVQAMFNAFKGSPIERADDPRIPALTRALSDTDPKVRLAATTVVFNQNNPGLSEEVRRAAIRTTADVHAYGQRWGNYGYEKDAANIIAKINWNCNPEHGRILQEALTQARQRYENTRIKSDGTPVGPADRSFTQPDGSRLDLDDKGRITKITYPAHMGGRTREFKYDADGNMTEMKDSDGKVWTRHREGGRYTNYWSTPKEGGRPGELSWWRGDIQLSPTGTYVERAARDGTTRTYLTDGRWGRAEFNSDGQLTRARYPDGRELEVTYQNGRPTEYKYGTPPHLRTYRLDERSHEVGATGQHYTTEFGRDGTYSYTSNAGVRYSFSPTGETREEYVGPPRHIQGDAGRLRETLQRGQPADGAIRALDETITRSGPIRDHNDPRMPLLREALGHESPEVRLAAARVLFNKDHWGPYVEELRRQALRAVGQIGVEAHQAGNAALKQKVDEVVNNHINPLQRRDYSDLLQQALTAQERPAPNAEVRRPDGSTVKYDDKGRVKEVVYPQRDGRTVARSFKYDGEGNLIEVTGPDGTLRRQSRDGRLLDEWVGGTFTAERPLKAKLEVAQDGTFTQLEETGTRQRTLRYFWTSGQTSYVEQEQFNGQWRATLATYPGGGWYRFRYNAAGEAVGMAASWMDGNRGKEPSAASAWQEGQWLTDRYRAGRRGLDTDGSYWFVDDRGVRHVNRPSGDVWQTYVGLPRR